MIGCLTDAKEYRELIVTNMVFCERCANWKPRTTGMFAYTYGYCRFFCINTDFNFYCQAGRRREDDKENETADDS